MPVRGSIMIPGDKSISHRALLISSLIPGKNYIQILSTAEDVIHTLQCLNKIGVNSLKDKDVLVIKGSELINPTQPLFCGNSGTTMRLLSGVLVGMNIPAELTGDQSLLKRPMDRVLKPLLNMGADMSCANNNCAPIIINKTDKLINSNYDMEVASAQVKSALLLASFGAKKKLIINEKFKTRNHTEIMLANIGADIE